MNAALAEWHSDPALRDRLVSEAEVLLGEGTPAAGPGATALLLALGRLARMQADAELAHLRSMTREPDALAATALSAFDFLALEGAALDFGIASPDLSAEAEEAGPARAQVLKALALRDEADLLLLGAETLLGQAPVLPSEASLALQEFDGVVQPILFRALPVNQDRQAALANVAPELRARVWWYARGCHLEPTGLEALAQAAEVLHTFPEAGRELEALQQVERGMAHMFAPRTGQSRATQSDLQSDLADERESLTAREQRTIERTGSSGRGPGDRRGR